MLRKASAKVSSISALIAAAAPLVNGFFGDDPIHENVVVLGRNLREKLALEGKRDQRRVRAGVLQELVVVTEAMPHPGARAIERDPGHHDEIELVWEKAFLGQRAQLGLRFEDLVHADR